jgi:hypothetical protein
MEEVNSLGPERPEVSTNDGIIDDPEYPPSAHLDRIYTEIKNRLDLQRTELDDLQRIVAIVLAANGVVLGFAGSQFPFGPSRAVYTIVIFVVAVGLLALDILVGVWALWPKQVIKAMVEPPALVDDYVDSATNEMLFDLIAAANAAYQGNESIGIRKRRSRLVRTQLLLLGIGALVLGAGIIISHV